MPFLHSRWKENTVEAIDSVWFQLLERFPVEMSGIGHFYWGALAPPEAESPKGKQIAVRKKWCQPEGLTQYFPHGNRSLFMVAPSGLPCSGPGNIPPFRTLLMRTAIEQESAPSQLLNRKPLPIKMAAHKKAAAERVAVIIIEIPSRTSLTPSAARLKPSIM